MNNKIVAQELILIAKSLLADTESKYVYDPDHKHRPQDGGGWEKTDKGWTNKKKEKTDKLGRTPEIIQKLQSLASNPKTDSKKLEELSFDRSWEVRKSVVENPATPIEVVKKRLLDKNIKVRQSAKERLGHWE